MPDKNSNVLDMSDYKGAGERKNPTGSNGKNGDGITHYRLNTLEDNIKEIKNKQTEMTNMFFHISGDIKKVEGRLDNIPGAFQLWIGIITAVISVSCLIYIIQNYTSG